MLKNCATIRRWTCIWQTWVSFPMSPIQRHSAIRNSDVTCGHT